MSRWKFFLPKSTAPVFSTELVWLAYVHVSTSPSQAGSVEKNEAADLAKKKFHGIILPQELIVRSPSKSEEAWTGLA